MRTYIKWNMGLLLLHSSKRSNTKNAFQKILVVTFVHWLEKWLCVCERALWLATLSLSQWIFYGFFLLLLFYNNISFFRVLILFRFLHLLPFFSSQFHCSEENVWKLCEQVKKTRIDELSKCYAVFVSNEGRTVPLWRQKAGRGDDQVVIWVSVAFLCFFFFQLCLPLLSP